MGRVGLGSRTTHGVAIRVETGWKAPPAFCATYPLTTSPPLGWMTWPEM